MKVMIEWMMWYEIDGLIVEFDDGFVENGLMDVIIRMEWFEFLM